MNELIIKNDGTKINWSKTNDNGFFCLLYNDDKKTYSFTPNEDFNCQLFMIGGGGAGGYFFGGGGGAGACYINNNHTFIKDITYTCEIGTGGKCDIDNIDNLFKSGLVLNVYNNTKPNLNKISFIHDDYSSLNINSSGMVQSFPVNSVNIPSTIWNNNTTYIWKGYIKTTSLDSYIKININTKIDTIIWVDNYVYNNNNALVQGDNISDIKIIKVEPNRYYNITIIAYCNNNAISNNFNIIFNNCELFNLDKNAEKYNYIQATDTKISYTDIDNNKKYIICKGGGNGGCGFYNQNTNLNGGCGGGSGINKKNGLAIIDKYYLGNDGAIGDYCGGGGGILSKGNNNKGGDGKILDWFNNTLIFGAGGNAANVNEVRNLGYGCGGNGGECCYYSKLMINNNGNNGCILIYLTPKEKQNITEKFTNNNDILNKEKNIVYNYIKNSYNITDFITSNGIITKETSRLDYFRDDYFAKTFLNNLTNLNKQLPYMIFICHKLISTVYKLFNYHFNVTLNNDPERIKNFLDNLKIIFIKNSIYKSRIVEIENTVYLNNIFFINNDIINADITNVNSLSQYKDRYKTSYYGLPNTTSSAINISNEVYEYNNDDKYPPIPLYHHIPNFSGSSITCNKFKYLSEYINDNAFIFSNYQFQDEVIDKNTLNTYIKNALVYKDSNSLENQYLIYSIYLLDIIFNTDKNNILPFLYYHTLNYSVILINFNLQYGLLKLQNTRIVCNSSNTCNKTDSNINTSDYILEVERSKNTITNITAILNNPSNFRKFKTNTSNAISENNKNTIEFTQAQIKLNKIISEYNNELELYNDIITGYKIVITSFIILLIINLFIFGTSYLNSSTKTMILSIIITIVIIIIIIYTYYNNVQEPFTVISNSTFSGPPSSFSSNIDISGYRSAVKILHDSVIIPTLSTLDINDAIDPALEYVNKMQIVKKQKINYYNNKYVVLKNSIELLKKSKYFYYYMIMLLSISIVILTLALIFYLLFPDLIIYNIILTFIIFIILLYYIFYNIHKATRLKENKNYWANYNPSSNTIDSL